MDTSEDHKEGASQPSETSGQKGSSEGFMDKLQTMIVGRRKGEEEKSVKIAIRPEPKVREESSEGLMDKLQDILTGSHKEGEQPTTRKEEAKQLSDTKPPEETSEGFVDRLQALVGLDHDEEAEKPHEPKKQEESPGGLMDTLQDLVGGRQHEDELPKPPGDHVEPPEGFMEKLQSMVGAHTTTEAESAAQKSPKAEKKEEGFMDKLQAMTGLPHNEEESGKVREGKEEEPGLMDKLHAMAGGGKESEKNEDGLDKAVDWVQEHVLGQGDQGNESAYEQAKDEAISDFIRGQYKKKTGYDFPIKDKDRF